MAVYSFGNGIEGGEGQSTCHIDNGEHGLLYRSDLEPARSPLVAALAGHRIVGGHAKVNPSPGGLRHTAGAGVEVPELNQAIGVHERGYYQLLHSFSAALRRDQSRPAPDHRQHRQV